MRQNEETQEGVNEERNCGMVSSDSWLLTSTGNVSLMEGVGANVKSRQRERLLISAERKRKARVREAIQEEKQV